MQYLIIIFLIIILLFVISSIRINLVYNARMQRLGEVSKHASKLIDNRMEWQWLYDDLTRTTFDQQLLEITKWKYKDFYPNHVSSRTDDNTVFKV